MTPGGETPTNPVFQEDDGTWWFWDETWGYLYGPCVSEADAEGECERYAREVLGL